jgi:hypothetical protein
MAENIAAGAQFGEPAGMQRGGGTLTAEGVKGAGALPLEFAAAGKTQLDAAKAQQQAAKALSDAAAKLQEVKLNRSDAPSPTAPR